MQYHHLLLGIVSLPVFGGIVTATRCLFKSPDVQITKESRQTKEQGMDYYNHPIREFSRNNTFNPMSKFYYGYRND